MKPKRPSRREQDQARRRYVRRYFNAEIDDPTLYDMTLNTDRLGFTRAAEVIAQLALQHRHAFAEHAERDEPALYSIQNTIKHPASD